MFVSGPSILACVVFQLRDFNSLGVLLLCVVEVKFKFLQNISQYYNNKFAFHMPMFTISILSFNKLNTTIHSNMRFMVIAYN
jgi:hypothetical protein